MHFVLKFALKFALYMLLDKVYNVRAKISFEKLCLMALNIVAKFEGTMAYAFKNDMRN